MARNKYPEETRNLIIDTASRLFIEKGYDHTSVQDIIDHLGGLSKGAIYHHFKSKEEIMDAVATKMYSASNQRLYEICSRKDLNGREKLRELFRASAFNPAQEEFFIAAPDMLKNPQLLALFLHDTVQKEAPRLIQGVLEEGAADGSIHAEHIKELSEVLMLVANVWLNPMIYHCELAEMAEKVKFFKHMLKYFDLDVIDDEVVRALENYAVLYSRKEEE